MSGGTAGRWAGPELPWEAALLLAPVALTDVAVVGEAERWRRALAWWGVAEGSGRSLVLAGSAADAVASGGQTLLVAGTDTGGVLRRAGYRTSTWSARQAPGGTVLLVEGRRGLRPSVRPPADPRDRARAAAVRAVRGLARPERLTVASRLPLVPALAARVGDDRACVVTGGGGPRRRPVLLTASAGQGRARHAVKAGRAAEGERGRSEQRVLTALREAGVGRGLPRPAGEGTLGPVSWTAETAAPGRPLAHLLGERGSAGQVRALLEDLGGWLGELGAATRSREVVVAPLEGEHAARAPGPDRLTGVPGVVAHGDLAAGFNVLVDGTDWTVLDWETARPDAPPLLDLLPLLCAALSADAVAPAARAERVLQLCAGEHPDSPWLLAQVHRYLRAVRVPVERAGALAALAFASQVSLQVVHERLVREAGDVPEPWSSAWADVERGWHAHPRLGDGWRALADALRP